MFYPIPGKETICMKEFPKGALIGRIVHLVRYVQSLDIPLYAANAGFFMILSLFPTLVLVLSLLRYTGLQVSSLVEVIGSVIPESLMGTVGELVLSTYENASGALVGVSAFTALWSASKGVYGLLTGLNRVYGVAEDRGWFYTRFISVVYTFAFLIVLFLTLVLHVFGQSVFRWLSGLDIPLLSAVSWLVRQRFILLLILQTLLFTAMYMFLPGKKNGFMESLPGALLSAVGWQVISLLFSVYVENFDSYANIYGSVYAVALCLLWLYLCFCILFYGASLNRWLKES